jgi:hypothetical protein
VPRGQRNGSLRLYYRFSRQEPLLFYQVAPQLYSLGRVDPVPDTLLFSFFFSSENLVVPGIEPGPVAKLHLCVDLTLREGYSITFCVKFV